MLACLWTFYQVLATMRKKSFENNVEKGEMLVISIFSIFHYIFCPIKDKFGNLAKIEMSSANVFSLDNTAFMSGTKG